MGFILFIGDSFIFKFIFIYRIQITYANYEVCVITPSNFCFLCNGLLSSPAFLLGFGFKSSGNLFFFFTLKFQLHLFISNYIYLKRIQIFIYNNKSIHILYFLQKTENQKINNKKLMSFSITTFIFLIDYCKCGYNSCHLLAVSCAYCLYILPLALIFC